MVIWSVQLWLHQKPTLHWYHKGMGNANIVIMIPAYEPNDKLRVVVRELKEAGYPHIIIVDDGSSNRCIPLFNELAKDCTVLRNTINRGKGYSLKKAIQYSLDHFPMMQLVVTVDADGQHQISDINVICNCHWRQPKAVILGVRDFTLPHIPMLRRMGNQLTSYLFQRRYHYLITDTQTGLRLFPRAILKDLVRISGDGYEYELAVLIWLVQQMIPICEQKIDTIYFEDQGDSHFKMIRDSFRIYRVLFGKKRGVKK